MSLLPVGISGEEAGYQIERSVRLNSSDSAYFSRTPASAGNRKTWTLSFWLKRTNLSGGSLTLYPFSVGSDRLQLRFTTADKLSFFEWNGSSMNFEFLSTQVFRDASAWYHIIFAVDTTQATASNRVKVYVNGSQVTAFDLASYPSLNLDTQVNSTATHYLGLGSGGGTNKLDGYMTEIHGIDGSALDPTSFGEFNEDTGVWQPKAYTGSYGTNGFYLNFSDNSGVTSTTLGADSSGNGNNWTPNNFSVTAGAGNDSLVDTPTPYGTDTGVGGEVRGNYATLNPLDNGNSNILLTNGNLSVSSSTTWDRGVKGTFGVASGKWYYEYTHGTVGGSNPAAELGWTKYSSLVNSYLNGGWGSADTYLVQGSDGTKWTNGSGSSYGSGFATGDVEMCAIDMDNGKVYWGKNGTWFASGDPAAGTNAAFTGLSGTFFPLWYWGLSPGTGGVLISNINFGQRPFAYTAPSGFKALCTQNLPEPTIVDGGQYFNTVLWTGDGSSPRTISGLDFQPDFVWIKNRTDAYFHTLYDAVRGVGARALYTSATAAENGGGADYASLYGYLSSFNSDGFGLTSGSDDIWTNDNAKNYVAWNWKANGAGVSNTAGTITSTVSANTDSGFSIVTYTGTGANATVGHGLGIAPSMIIFKGRSTTFDWMVYHTSLNNTNYLRFNTTAASAASSSAFNDTSPTSTVFSLGDGSLGNQASATQVAYCFAAIPGYSAMGSFVGNGSTDGSFIFTNHRPAFLLIKATGLAESWYMVDNARNTYNVVNLELNPNSSGAEATYTVADFLSNGFKLRQTDPGVNQSGQTYIYMSFAENPFRNALAR